MGLWWYSWLYSWSCQCGIDINANAIKVRLVSVRRRSLLIYSSWHLIGQVVVLGGLTRKALAYVLCISYCWSYSLCLVKWCGNSAMLSSTVGNSIYMGLNVSWLFNVVLRSLDLALINIACYVGVYMMGRISGDAINRSLGLSNGLCIRLCNYRMLDVCIISLSSQIGAVGLSVGIIL